MPGRYMLRHCVAILLFSLAANAQTEDRKPSDYIAAPTPTPGLGTLREQRLQYVHSGGLLPPAGRRFGNVSGVALTPAGNLIVFNRNFAIMMLEYDRSGQLLRKFNPNIAGNPHGMRIDRYGNMWITDSFLNLVWKLDSGGAPLFVLGTRGEVGPWTDEGWNNMFNQPLDVAFDRDDNLYVVQGHGGTAPPADCTYCATYRNTRPAVEQGSDPRILKFDSAGRFLSSRPLLLNKGKYPFIHTVIVTPDDELWVGDREANRILVFDLSLRPLREISMPTRVSGLFVDARNQIWMSSGMDGVVLKLSRDGAVLGWFGQAGRSTEADSNLVGEAHYLAVTPDQQTIFVADSVNARVHRFVQR
jgi:DNA-binding beta-propeller fold protein YncE